MPDLIHDRVLRATELPDRYLAHAAHQSLSVYLDDWEQAHFRLGRRIALLRRLRDERETAANDGTWPPQAAPMRPEEDA